ncbi:uncharacterized protein ehbp1l1a isoform X3 [Dicentrarchus labrax]|uniref:uncharacterized protein ehbp1l1a isoform X3 n=2 Tax=Dicentrarchus labrax TaxID=13489 RepID=UPI0021F6255C|nr:uncharacterized protein ehbp1l1a isoform X3 [Dicentrarchus labrax]
MTSVWKRLQRVGKKASKFQFAASFQELMIECTKKWQPDKLRVVWIRRNRRHSTKLHSWQPGIKNPYRGLVVWQVPESLDITVTLFKEPTAEEFEDKDWTFVIENETKGRRKVLASADINMKKFASATPAQYDVTLKLKPLSVKVVEATLKLNLSCIFLKEGKATDEDMQSLASLMSMKQSDIGNLDDFNDSDDEAGEERRASFGQATHVSASATRVHDLAWRPVIESGPTVTSEMDWKASSGISSTISVPSRPPLPEPPDPSVPSFLRTRPPSATQQARPSPYAYSLPAFTRAHPPALPKIFQPSAGSAPRRPHSFHSDSSPAEGLEALSFSIFTPSKALSTSSLSSSPSDPSLHPPPTSCDTSQTACPSGWKAQSVPSFASVSSSSSSSAPLSSFPPIPPPPPTRRQPKARLTSVGESCSALTRPTSLPSAPETASWQSEWRPPKSQAPLAQPALSPKCLHLSANDPEQPAVLQKKQRIEMPCNALFSLPTGQSLEQEPHGGSGFVPSWSPQITTVETPPLSSLSPAPVLCGPALPPPQPQTALASPTDQDAEFRRQLSTLSEEDNQSTTPTTSDPRATASGRPELSIASERKRDTHFGIEVVKASAGPESMASLLPHSSRTLKAPGLKYFETPKTQMDQTESRPARTFPNVQPTLPPFTCSLKQNPDFQDPASASVKELLFKPRSHVSKMSIRLGNLVAEPEPVQREALSPTNPEPTSISLQGPLLHLPHIATTFDTKPIGRIAAHKKEAVTMDLGNESMAASVSSCLRNASSACPPMVLNITPEVEYGEWSIAKNSQSEKLQKDTRKISPAVPVMDKKIICNTSASDNVTTRLESYFGILSAQQPKTGNTSKQREEPNVNFASSSSKSFVVDDLDPCIEKERTEHVDMDKRPLCESDKRVTQELMLPNSAVTIEEKCVYTSVVEYGPLCPRESSVSHLSSILQPEAQIEETKKVPSMIKLLSSCPQYSKIPGMTCLHQSQVIAWLDDRRLLFRKLPSHRFPLLLHSNYVSSLYEGSTGTATTVHLTPSCSRSASIPGFPSALKREPNMTHLLPTCPRNCRIPGLACAGSMTVYGKSVWVRHSLWTKPLQTKEAFILNMSCVQEQAVSDTNMIIVMVAMLPTCPRKASVPGFPSAPLQKVSNTPSMASLLPTCPKQTMIAGMPFRQRVMAKNDSWHFLRREMNGINGPLRSNPVRVQESKSKEDKEYMKHMVNMSPSCPWKAKNPGFPSVSQKEPSVPGVPFVASQYPCMADFLPTCPRKTRVIGLPSKEPGSAQGEFLALSKHILMEKPLSVGEVLIQDISPVGDLNKSKMFCSVAMLPSCPVRTRLAGMPTGPQKLLPSIVSFVPTCPKLTQIPGMPSRDQNRGKQNRDWHASRRIINKRSEQTRHAYIVQWLPKDTESLKNMVDMFCPQKANVFGLPSAPREPSMVNVMPSCPRNSGVHGLPSKTGQKLCLSRCNEWFAYKSLQWESQFIKREVLILNAVSCFDQNTAMSMIAILPSCPENASVPGFPSALTPTIADGPTMVHLLHSCTKESRVPGMPVRDTTKQLEWLMERKSLLFPGEKFGVTSHLQDVNVFYLDCDTIINMVSILPSCPPTACLPGFPSIPCQMLEDMPSMINLLQTCPRHSRVCGIPSRVHSESGEAEWSVDKRPVWERPLTNLGRLSVIHDYKMCFREKTVVGIMVSMLPPCPKHSYIPGIPSKVVKKSVKAVLNEAPSMLKSLGNIPKHCKIPGLPAKNSANNNSGWYLDRDAVWENPFNRRYGVVHQDFTVKEMSYRDKEIMLSMLPSCPQQALNPGFPSAPRPRAVDAIVEKNADMVQLLPCCPRQSNIIGFPSRASDSSDSKVEGWPVVMIRTQGFCPFYKKYGSPHKECPNIVLSSGIIAVPQPDLDRLSNMVNILPSCPKKGSVLGVQSTHVHHSGLGWPVKTLLLMKSETKTIGKQRENLMSQELSLEEHSFCKFSVNKRSMRFIVPSQNVPEDVHQRVTTKPLTCPVEAIVQDLPSSNSGIQVDQPSSRVNDIEMLWDESSPTRLNLDSKKTKSDVCSPLEMHKDDHGFWIPIEAEEIALLEKGDLHCRMWHSIPDMPLFLSVRKSLLGQKETEISMYEKGGTVGKEAETAEVTVQDHGFMPLEEPNKTSVESMNVITTSYDTVEQGCVRYSESGHENMISLQPSCQIAAGAKEPLSQAQIDNAEQHLEKHPTNRTIIWEELPKATTVKCPTDKTILWEELPKVTTELTRNTSEDKKKIIKEMVSVVPSLPGAAMITSLWTTMLDTEDEMKRKTEVGMAGLLPICPTVSRKFEFTASANQTECVLDSDKGDKSSKDNEVLTTVGALHLKGHADLVEQIGDKKSSCASAQCMPYYVKSEIESKQYTFLETCPTVTYIAGMPSKLPVKEEQHWNKDQKPMWEKQSKMKELLQPYASKDDEKNKKEMVLLVSSCPKEARNPGFPSVPQCSLVFYGPNMVNIYPSCPSVSNIPGSPSISEANKGSWVSQKEPLLKKKMKTGLVFMTVSPKEKDECRLMGALLPTCPKHSCIPGFPSSPHPTIAHHGSDMMSLLSSCPTTSLIEGIPSLMEHLSKSWTTDYKPLGLTRPKVDTVMIEDRLYNDNIQTMSALAPTCPKEACIPGFPSVMEPTLLYKGFSRVNILPSCPATSSMAGFPSMQKADNKDWNSIHVPLWEKQIKKETILLQENNKIDEDLKGVVSLAQSCPRESKISGFPSVPKPRMINVVHMTNMVSLSSMCSKMSQIPGFQSFCNSEEWTISREPLFEPRMKDKQVSLIDRCESHRRAMKAMVSLVPSCPKEARVSGFPSHPNPVTVYCAQNIVSLFTLCSQVSRIPGFPSVYGNMSVGWVTENGSLLKRLPKKGVIFDTSNDNNRIMKNMVSCVPSCPKMSSIPGFPSVPNAKTVYYGLNVVNLLPLCPPVSIIPGFSSVEGHKEEGWVAEQGSLMHRPQKNTQFRINSSPVNIDKPNNMLALVPSCPGSSKIPGFPSVPRYNMLSLVSVCPKVSSLPGFASVEGASKFQWLFDAHTLFDKPPKETLFVIHSQNQVQSRETMKTMLALAPSCPEVSRTAGFPSAPQTKSKIEPNMISFVPCCSSASGLKGFASMTTIPSTGWLNETKPILIKPQETRAEMIMLLSGQDKLYCDNMKSMVTLVTSCPKEARVRGFPSAQTVNTPPNMVSLYPSAPCVSSVPGFPSARMLSSECINIQTRTTQSKPLFEKLRNDKIFLIAKFRAKHKHTQDEMKYMVAMAPSCPQLTKIPGFPSISQLNPTEKETLTNPFPCSTEKHTPQELPTQSHLKDTRIPDVPSTSISNPNTALAYEEKFKGGAKKNIDLCVDKGQSQIERIAAEETQTVKKPLDTSEAAGVLGWEVLEAEETITEKQTESTLSAKQEDTSGLVKAIVGVFHKGYETVASILGPSSSTLAEEDHQPKALSSMELKDKTQTPLDECFSDFVDNNMLIQKIEGQFEDIHTKHSIEYPTSAEPYMLDLVGGRSASPSPATDSDDGFLVCASMKKWPPLTEADITEISKDNSEQVKEREAAFDKWHTKERSFTGQDSVQTPVHVENVLVGHQTLTEQDEVRTVSTSSQLDKGPQKSSMEDISATCLQPTSNESLTDASSNKEILMDKPSAFLNISPIGPQADIVPQRGRRPRRKVPEPQQQGCDQEKDTAPLRPLRRKDSLTPDRKQKSDSLSVKLLPEVIPVQFVREDAPGEIIPAQPAIDQSSSIKKGDSGVPLDVPQNKNAQERVQVTLYTGDQREKEEAESVQICMDVVPPPRVKRRDGSLPPETPKTTAPCKPLRRKDGVTRGTFVSKTNNQWDLKVSSALKTSDPVPSQPCERSSNISGALETLQSIDKPSQTSTEMIPSQSVGRKDQTTTSLVRNASLQADTELIGSKDLEQTSFTPEWSDKDINMSVQASSHKMTKTKTKEIESIAPNSEPDIFHVDQTASLSIIKKIRLPQSGKRLPSRKSVKIDSDKEIMEQNLNVANKESLKPVQIDNAVMTDIEEIKQSNIAGDAHVDIVNVTSSQKSENVSELAQAEKHKQTTICILKPHVRKQLSSFPDVTFMESTPSHGEEPQAARQGGSLFISSTTKELTKMQHRQGLLLLPLGDQPSTSAEAVAPVKLRRSRLTIESSVQVQDNDISEKSPGDLSLPVPKPRVKKRLSGSFQNDVTISGSPTPGLPDTVADTIGNESVQRSEPSSFPVPLPRAKKRLSATYSITTPPIDNVSSLEMESSQRNREDTSVTSKETKEGSTALDSSVISEGGFVTIQGEDDVTSKLEREVLAAMREEFTQADSVEDNEKALDEIIDGWTFTDKPVTDELEKAAEAMSEQADIEKVLEAEVDRSLVSTVASSQDDWLHVENDKDSEPMEKNSRKDIRDEELDFGFVSVDVATGCLEEER